MEISFSQILFSGTPETQSKLTMNQMPFYDYLADRDGLANKCMCVQYAIGLAMRNVQINI